MLTLAGAARGGGLLERFQGVGRRREEPAKDTDHACEGTWAIKKKQDRGHERERSVP